MCRVTLWPCGIKLNGQWEIQIFQHTDQWLNVTVEIGFLVFQGTTCRSSINQTDQVSSRHRTTKMKIERGNLLKTVSLEVT